METNEVAVEILGPEIDRDTLMHAMAGCWRIARPRIRLKHELRR